MAPALNSTDYAIVVGIANYPGFGTTPAEPHDLKGPVNDATAIFNWLVDPAKGGVDPARAKLICSPTPVPPNYSITSAVPATVGVVNEFARLEALAQSNPNANPPVGRRLYVYMSGHGFAPGRAQGAIFCANATSVQTEHVYATAWIDWFYNAAYFEEFVLWLDCCMNYQITVMPQLPSFRRVQGNSAHCRVFSAYSARFKMQSVEALMSDGLVHGVFTYTLLKGLDVAADDNGDVTSASLKRYLINRMKDNLPTADKQSRVVSTEPDFGFDDPMILARACGLDTKQLEVHNLPDGTMLRILGGNPARQVATIPVHAGRATVNLPPGNYAAETNGSVVFTFSV